MMATGRCSALEHRTEGVDGYIHPTPNIDGFVVKDYSNNARDALAGLVQHIRNWV
jgi:hypothetical protein